MSGRYGAAPEPNLASSAIWANGYSAAACANIAGTAFPSACSAGSAGFLLLTLQTKVTQTTMTAKK